MGLPQSCARVGLHMPQQSVHARGVQNVCNRGNCVVTVDQQECQAVCACAKMPHAQLWPHL